MRRLHVANPDLGTKPLLARLRQQRPDLGAATKEVRKALEALKAGSDILGFTPGWLRRTTHASQQPQALQP